MYKRCSYTYNIHVCTFCGKFISLYNLLYIKIVYFCKIELISWHGACEKLKWNWNKICQIIGEIKNENIQIILKRRDIVVCVWTF